VSQTAENRPSLLTRVVAGLRGEQSAEVLEAYRRAGGVVYAELTATEELRGQFVGEKLSPRQLPSAVASQLLCTWNAYVLQTSANRCWMPTMRQTHAPSASCRQ
jgi:hypothetical protein